MGSPYLKTYWQPNRFRDFSYNLEALKALAPAVICVHVQRWAGDTRFFLHEFQDEWEQYTAVLKAAGADYKFNFRIFTGMQRRMAQFEAETLRAPVKISRINSIKITHIITGTVSYSFFERCGDKNAKKV